MAKSIYCERCCGEIANKNDLIVTNKFLSIVPYHEKCFSKELKGLSTIFVSNVPINGTSSNVCLVILLIIGVISLFIKELRYVSALALISLCIRIYSWFQYERHL